MTRYSGTEVWASIDLGAHTSRMLVCRKPAVASRLEPLFRKMHYLRLGADPDLRGGEKTLGQSALERTVASFEDFLLSLSAYERVRILAVGTGVVREAGNRETFLNRLFERTGIEVKPITSQEEALLTLKGVKYGLAVEAEEIFVFDLGGGSTDFIVGKEENPEFGSMPLGALSLTKGFLPLDPPGVQELEALERRISEILERNLSPVWKRTRNPFAVATGGTVTTLACSVYKVPFVEAGPEDLNGLVLTVPQIKEFLRAIRGLGHRHMADAIGLDRERAEVMTAGSMAVLRIMEMTGLEGLAVSLSDLLEGLLLRYLEEKQEWM